MVGFEVVPNTILGTWGQDDLLGTNQADYIATYLGDDTVIGNGGNDVIVSGIDGNGSTRTPSVAATATICTAARTPT